MKKIEDVISEAIKQKGLIQKFVAQNTHIKESNLSQSLSGKRAFKSSELIALSLFLGLTIQDFEGCIGA